MTLPTVQRRFSTHGTRLPATPRHVGDEVGHADGGLDVGTGRVMVQSTYQATVRLLVAYQLKGSTL